MTRLSLMSLFPTGQLARNTYLTSGWLALRVLGQTIWVIVLARSLGPGGYGMFAGITALAATMGTLTGLGFGLLMLQDVSRQRSTFSSSWNRALGMAIASGILLCILYWSIARLIFDQGVGDAMYVAVGITELIAVPIVIISSYAFQSHERMGWSGTLFALIPCGNLIALGAFIYYSPSKTLASYLPFHAGMAVLTALSSIILVKWILSPVRARLSLTKRDLQEGAGFSAMRLADTAMNSLDKTLVLQLASTQAAGLYSAAYRLIVVATLPIVSLSISVLPRLFRAGVDKQGGTLLLARNLVIAVLIYGIFAGIATWLASDLLPILLGQQFAPAVQIVKWLAISPLLQGLYIVGANLLVTQQMRALRILAQCLVVVIMLTAAMIFIPALGLEGAVVMLLITQSSAALLVWLCFLLGQKKLSP